jgi:hypothetical protein
MATEDVICLAGLLPWLVLLVIRVIVCYWIYNDARRHSIDHTIWTILGFILGLIGLIVYFVFREDVYKKKARHMYWGGYRQAYYNPYAYAHRAPYTPSHYGHRYTEYRRGLDPDIICEACGHIVKNVPVGGILFCENCGAQVKR